MLIDTGATLTAVRPAFLESLGFRRSSGRHPVGVIGAMSVGVAAQGRIPRMEMRDVVRSQVDVIVMDLALPPHIDGLLGMDFLQGALVTINTVEGWVEVVDIQQP